MERGRKFLKILANRMVELFDNDLLMSIDEHYTIEKVESIELSDITALIKLKGELPATVGMSVSKRLSGMIAENYIFGGYP